MNGFEKRAQEKQKQVLAATFELMNDKGVAGVTIDEVVKRSEVSKATIFKYFGSKEQLILKVFIEFMNEMGDAAKKIMAQNLPFEETLIALSQNKLHYLEKINKQFFMDLMDCYTQKNKDNEITLLMNEYTKESFNLMLDLFHRGRKEGKVDLKYSDEFLMLYFQAMLEGISNPQIYARILPYTAEWTEMMIKGIAPKRL